MFHIVGSRLSEGSTWAGIAAGLGAYANFFTGKTQAMIYGACATCVVMAAILPEKAVDGVDGDDGDKGDKGKKGDKGDKGDKGGTK